MKRYLAALVVLPVLSACTAGYDMQGKNPKEHYTENPVKNTVETRSESQTVHFIQGRDRLSADAIDGLRAGLSKISPEAVDNVVASVHKSQMTNTLRKQHITKLLYSMGYKKRSIMFEPSDSVERNEMKLNVSYAIAVGPRCPDWRTSPVTTYSNTGKGGFGCATVTNLGLMVADPRDLEHGNGSTSPDGERNAEVLTNYRANKGAGADAASSEDVGTTATSQ